MEVGQYLTETFSAFMILFAVIDIVGSIPLVVGMLDRGQTYRSGLAALIALGFYLLFFFLGHAILGFFGVDYASFAVAGALIMLALAVEMIFDIRIFSGDSPTSNVTIVPLVFPLIAGPGSITTMLSLRSVYSDPAIITAIVLNLVVVYFTLRHVNLVKRMLGDGGIYAMRKFFGIVLMAVGMKMLITNLATIIQEVSQAICKVPA